MLDSTCYCSFLVCWRKGGGKLRYFLFKTRSVCHLRPGELTHSGRKYDIDVAFCNLGKLWMDCALVLSLLSCSAHQATSCTLPLSDFVTAAGPSIAPLFSCWHVASCSLLLFQLGGVLCTCSHLQAGCMVAEVLALQALLGEECDWLYLNREHQFTLFHRQSI